MISALFPTPAAPRVIGGAELAARRLTDALVERGFDVHVLRAGSPLSAIGEEQMGRVCVTSLPMRRPFSPFEGAPASAWRKLMWHLIDDIGDIGGIGEHIRRVKPDLVHSHNVGGLSTGVWRAAHAACVPIVHTLHDYYMLCPRTTRLRRGAVCVRTCTDCRMLTFRRRADTALVGDVVGVSKAVLTPHVREGLFAKAGQHVIPNIIEPQFEAAPAAVRSPVTLGFLGRVTVEKGAERLAQAFGAMKAPARLVMGGRVDDGMKARLIALAKGRPIEFPGFVSAAEFYRTIDVLVVPSIWEEPLPTVILEAQTAGKPTIARHLGGMSEAIGSDEAGWTFDDDRPGGLAGLLDEVVQSPKAIAAKAAFAYAASARFRKDKVVSRYAQVYDRAIHQRTGS